MFRPRRRAPQTEVTILAERVRTHSACAAWCRRVVWSARGRRGVLSGVTSSLGSAADHVWFRQLPAETSLTLSETIANLELMEARGVVARDLVDGAYRFR